MTDNTIQTPEREAEELLKCTDCNGSGIIVVADFDGEPEQTQCPRCEFTGYLLSRELISAISERLSTRDAQRDRRIKAECLEEIRNLWNLIDMGISGRLFDHPLYSLTQIRRGIRIEFNGLLGVDEELESAFQGGREANPPVVVKISGEARAAALRGKDGE